VRWEDFRAAIEAVTETRREERKSNAGRKPYDAILKFKILVLQSLHNLSDEQTEYLIRDRISFMALSRSGAGGRGAGCHHDLAFPRGFGTGRAD
jgi:transposase, IS5 family